METCHLFPFFLFVFDTSVLILLLFHVLCFLLSAWHEVALVDFGCGKRRRLDGIWTADLLATLRVLHPLDHGNPQKFDQCLCLMHHCSMMNCDALWCSVILGLSSKGFHHKQFWQVSTIQFYCQQCWYSNLGQPIEPNWLMLVWNYKCRILITIFIYKT